MIGLSIGWQLQRAGLSVQVYDKRQAGRQASWAAAGMLAPYSEDERLTKMGEESLALYPRFLQELAEDSGCAFPEEKRGTLWVAVDRDDCEWLRVRYEVKKQLGMPVEWVSGEEAREREPLLSPRVVAGMWIGSEQQVDNRLLVEALKRAFLKRGGELLEGVSLEQPTIQATGAWAPGVRPTKGQLMRLRMPPHLELQQMIRSPRVYLAPKAAGHVCMGATSEDQGFDERVTAGAVLEILEHAWELVPAIAEYPVEELAVGFRPTTPDGMPRIDATTAIGHGRAGCLLAPYTAYKVADAYLG
jgi:glycine oxidase